MKSQNSFYENPRFSTLMECMKLSLQTQKFEIEPPSNSQIQDYKLKSTELLQMYDPRLHTFCCHHFPRLNELWTKACLGVRDQQSYLGYRDVTRNLSWTHLWKSGLRSNAVKDIDNTSQCRNSNVLLQFIKSSIIVWISQASSLKIKR